MKVRPAPTFGARCFGVRQDADGLPVRTPPRQANVANGPFGELDAKMDS